MKNTFKYGAISFLNNGSDPYPPIQWQQDTMGIAIVLDNNQFGCGLAEKIEELSAGKDLLREQIAALLIEAIVVYNKISETK